MRDSVARTVSIALWCSLGIAGCGGYAPIRRPNSDLWQRSVAPVLVNAVPEIEQIPRTQYAQQDGVRVSAALLDAGLTRAVFQADLVGRGVQPLALAIHNDSDRTYQFQKGRVEPRYVPAARAARYAAPPLITRTARELQWLGFFVPGLLMEGLIEPLSTIDFPKFEEAARRPAAMDRRGLAEAFAAREIPDAEVPPQGALEGVMFIPVRPVDRPLTMRLVDAQTQQPLELPLGLPATYVTFREYPQTLPIVWSAASAAARQIKSWRVMSDSATGVISARPRASWPMWIRHAPVTISLQQASVDRTVLKVEGPWRGKTTEDYGRSSPTIDRFLATLDAQFLSPPAEPAVDAGHPS